jgi:hypothetical protein
VKTPLPITHCRFPIGAPPALAATPARALRASSFALHAPRSTLHAPPPAPRAFTLVEILVSISLLSFIVIGLFAMFNQTQRAFRLGMTQSDLLEAGRAVTEMIPRELEQAVPSYRNAVNFSVVMIPNSAPLTQLLPGGAPPDQLSRTNFLEDCFILQRQNQSWVGVGYCVRTNDATGRLWLPEVSPGKLGAGTLYRFETSLPALLSAPGFPNNGLPQDPSQLFVAFLSNSVPGALASRAISNRICDGVVHFRLRAFATNGYPLFSDAFHTNACFRTNSLALGTSLVRQTRAVANLTFPDNWSGLYFISNAVPAAVEMELGLLEQAVWERYNSIGNDAARLAYLQREDISSRVHLFRQRIPIRNVDPLPYQ